MCIWARGFFLGIDFAKFTTKDEEESVIGYMRKRQGLTIVELVITMAIVAVLMAAMIPSLGRWVSHYRIKRAARDIASCFRLAQMTAVETNQTCSVRFSSGGGIVTVIRDPGGANDTIRTVNLGESKAQFDTAQGGGDGLDFVDQAPVDGIINVTYNTRGIPSDEQGNPLTPPGGQDGQRVFLETTRNEGYWVEVTPVGNVRHDKYKG